MITGDGRYLLAWAQERLNQRGALRQVARLDHQQGVSWQVLQEGSELRGNVIAGIAQAQHAAAAGEGESCCLIRQKCGSSRSCLEVSSASRKGYPPLQEGCGRQPWPAP